VPLRTDSPHAWNALARAAVTSGTYLLAHLLRVEIGLAIDVRVLSVHVHSSAHRALPLP
jgi:hypothetical protein